MKLSKEFYLRDDVLEISRGLLGKYLFTHIGDDEITGGMIVETEAYAGIIDKASHAYGERRTKRTQVMYHPGGVAYVYLCYGIHSMFNVITNKEDVPHAILIRAIQPTHGIETILKRRKMSGILRNTAGGPGMLTKALSITLQHDGLELAGDTIWIEDLGQTFLQKDIIESPRVGIDYAEEFVQKPWRFRIKNSRWTSLPH